MKALKAIESAHNLQNQNDHAEQLAFYTLGYLLSGDRSYHISGRTFSSVDNLTQYMKELIDVSYEDFAAFCNQIINKDSSLDPQFEAWLIALGRRKELDDWKKSTIGR